MTEGRRPARVAERIREYVAQAMLRDLSDPRLTAVGITRVEVPPDLSMAAVYVRHFIGDANETSRREAVRVLRSAAGRLRRGLNSVLGMKKLPELRFEYDTGPDASQRIEELLHEIDAERSPKEP